MKDQQKNKFIGTQSQGVEKEVQSPLNRVSRQTDKTDIYKKFWQICQTDNKEPISKKNISKACLEQFEKIKQEQMEHNKLDENFFLFEKNKSAKNYFQKLLMVTAYLRTIQKYGLHHQQHIYKKIFFEKYLIQNLEYQCQIAYQQSMLQKDQNLMKIINKYSSQLILKIQDKNFENNQKLQQIFFLYCLFHNNTSEGILNQQAIQNKFQAIFNIMDEFNIIIIILPCILVQYLRHYNFKEELTEHRIKIHEKILSFLDYQNSQICQVLEIIVHLTLNKDQIQRQRQNLEKIFRDKNEKEKSQFLKKLIHTIQIITNFQIDRFKKIEQFLQSLVGTYDKQKKTYQSYLNQSVSIQMVITMAVCKHILYMISMIGFDQKQSNYKNDITCENQAHQKFYQSINDDYQTFKALGACIYNLIQQSSKNNSTSQSLVNKIKQQLKRLQISISDVGSYFDQQFISLPKEQKKERIWHIMITIFTKQCFRYRVQIINQKEILDAMNKRNFQQARQLVENILSPLTSMIGT